MTKHEKIHPGVRAALGVAHDLQRKNGDPLDVLTKKFSDHSEAVLEQLKKSDDAVTGLKAQLLEIEQKVARDGGGGDQFVETWGQTFVKAAETELAAMVHNRHAKASVQVKALTTGGDSGGALIVPHRDAPNMLPQRRLTIRALLPVVNIASSTVEYVQQDSRPTGAAMVAEGAAKPESSMAFSLEMASTKVIAHHIKASRQVLEDAPQLADIIDTEMRYGLALVEEAQILSGDGTGQNLYGLIPAATAFADTAGILAEITSGPNHIDVIGAAILQSALADFPPSGIVIHWSDWWRMVLTKDGEGNYILGSPQSMAMPQMWGLPVVPTKAISAGSFLVGDFSSAATLYDRWAPRVETGYVNDDFTKNLVTILAEERVALAVKQGGALITGTFAEALA